MAKGKTTKLKWNSALPSTREWQERTRAKIKTGDILDRLGKCALGEIDMPAPAVQAAKTLLDRVLPSLTQADINSRPQEQADYGDLLSKLTDALGESAANALIASLSGKRPTEETPAPGLH